MDTSSTLLGIGLLVAFIAPIGYLIINQSRQEKAGKKTLFTAASEFNLEISEFTLLNGLSLGLDNKQGKLLFLAATNKNKPEVIVLSGTKVQLMKKHLQGNPDASIDELREVYLRIEGQEANTLISFYCSGIHPVTESSMRLQKALEWEKTLRDLRI